jgi:hypothetical protein
VSPAGSAAGPTGSATRLGHAVASWGTWRIPAPSEAVVGRWSSAVPDVRAPSGAMTTLDFQAVATAPSPCTTDADEGLQGQISALLGSLRPHIVRS